MLFAREISKLHVLYAWRSTNFHGVLFFVIFVVDLAVTKFPCSTCSTPELEPGYSVLYNVHVSWHHLPILDYECN